MHCKKQSLYTALEEGILGIRLRLSVSSNIGFLEGADDAGNGKGRLREPI
jgi:hypothetical protein